MLRRARASFFWEGMEPQIRQMVSSCTACNTYHKANQKEAMLSHPVPEYPWQYVHMDFAVWNGKQYLIATCSFTNWIEAPQITSQSASVLVQCCDEMFSRFGVPEMITSDSGTQFKSREFATALARWNSRLVTSSPHYHQSNGAAERAVQTYKTLLKKCLLERSNLQSAILALRNTPNATTGLSPAQRMFGRPTRTPFTPHTSDMKKSALPGVHEDLLAARMTAAKASDKRAAVLPPFSVDDDVWVQTPGESHWSPSKVLEVNKNRSYRVSTPSGSVLRNRVHLRNSPAAVEPVSEDASQLSDIAAQTNDKLDLTDDDENFQDYSHGNGEQLSSLQNQRKSSRSATQPDRHGYTIRPLSYKE